MGGTDKDKPDSNSAKPSSQAKVAPQEYVRGIPDYDYKPMELKFIRGKVKLAAASNGGKEDDGDSEANGFEAFKGEGMSLRGGGQKSKTKK